MRARLALARPACLGCRWLPGDRNRSAPSRCAAHRRPPRSFRPRGCTPGREPLATSPPRLAAATHRKTHWRVADQPLAALGSMRVPLWTHQRAPALAIVGGHATSRDRRSGRAGQDVERRACPGGALGAGSVSGRSCSSRRGCATSGATSSRRARACRRTSSTRRPSRNAGVIGRPASPRGRPLVSPSSRWIWHARRRCSQASSLSRGTYSS